MMIMTFILAFLIGFIRGGSLRPFADLKLQALWLVLAAFVLQALMRIWHLGGLAVGALYGATYVMLAVFIVFNRARWELLLLGIGMLSNAAVIWANGGKMPVSVEVYARATGVVLTNGIDDPTHIVLNASTRLPWLADRWALAHPFPLPAVVSAGDVLVSLGLFLLVQHVMLQGKGRRPRP